MTARLNDEQFDRLVRRFQVSLPSVLENAFGRAFQMIGQQAVSNYMELRSFDFSDMRFGPKSTDKLGIRTSRLSRSLSSAQTFTGNTASGEDEGIRRVLRRGNTFIGEFGSTVPYAAIHEYGGIINHPGGWTINMPARPYLQPAVEDKRDEIITLFDQAIAKLVGRID